MSDTLRVRAVEGRCYPQPGRPGEFVGLKRAPKGAKEVDVVHTVPVDVLVDTPQGQRRETALVRYVAAGAVEVPNTRAIRQALKRGDLALATEDSAPRRRTTAAKDSGGKDEG